MRGVPTDIGTIHFVGIGGIGMSGIAETLHALGYAVQGSDVAEGANIERLHDVQNWWDVAKGPVTPVIEDENKDFISEALNQMPSAPWDEETWGVWTSKLKEATGRKGRALFMPLRQALTGMEHGPDMPSLLLLIGPEKAAERLKG